VNENTPLLNRIADALALVPRVRAFFCGLCFSILLILAFSPIGMWFLAPLIPVPLMILAHRPHCRAWTASIFAAAGSIPAWFWTHQWVFDVSVLGAPFLILYLALWVGFYVLVAERLVRRFGSPWVTLAVVWGAVEFGRSVFLSGYPWYLSAHPLIESVTLSAPAGIGGFPLVTLFAAFVSSGITILMVSDRRVNALLEITAVIVVWVSTGFVAIGLVTEGEDEIVVGIVQPNIPQDNRMDWTERQRYSDWLMLRSLTEASALDPEVAPDVILWPEGLTPGWTFDPVALEIERSAGYGWKMEPDFPGDAPDLVVPRTIPATRIVDELLEFQAGIGIPMIVGGPTFHNLDIVKVQQGWIEYQNDGIGNSAFLVEDGAISQTWYDKLHLTPFGEVMPVISRWDWLEQSLLSLGASGMSFSIVPGDEPVVLEFEVDDRPEPVRAATPICFEATIASVCRELVFGGGERRADLLVNITNDGWFGFWDPGREAHLLTSRWRSVELATPMVRSANTGFSCAIDTSGRVTAREITPLGDDPREGFLNTRVRLGSGSTIYARIGNLVGWGVFGIVGVGVIVSFLRKTSEPTPMSDQ